jgi:hypothetical protein
MLKVCKAKMHGVVRACAVAEVSKTGKSDNKRITALISRIALLHKCLIMRWLPRMHDKVIQSHLYSRELGLARQFLPPKHA